MMPGLTLRAGGAYAPEFTAEEGIALPDFRSLLTERLCKAVKTLRRTHDNSAIFPILRNDFQHLRRKVLALVTAEPILHFINTGNHALDTVFIADQKPPIIQFFILATQGEVCDTLGFRVFLTPCKGLLSHCNGFTVPLHTVNGEKFTLETVRIEDSTHQALHPSYSAEKSGQRIKLDFPSIIIGGKAKRDSQFLNPPHSRPQPLPHPSWPRWKHRRWRCGASPSSCR